MHVINLLPCCRNVQKLSKSINKTCDIQSAQYTECSCVQCWHPCSLSEITSFAANPCSVARRGIQLRQLRWEKGWREEGGWEGEGRKLSRRERGAERVRGREGLVRSGGGGE